MQCGGLRPGLQGQGLPPLGQGEISWRVWGLRRSLSKPSFNRDVPLEESLTGEDSESGKDVCGHSLPRTHFSATTCEVEAYTWSVITVP